MGLLVSMKKEIEKKNKQIKREKAHFNTLIVTIAILYEFLIFPRLHILRM